MRKFSPLILSFLLIVSGCGQRQAASINQQDDLEVITQAYHNKQSHLFVQARGFVRRILPDNFEGSHHQRFIVKLANGQTLLIVHNIDVAPRINDLKVGGQVYFRGEYQWNDRGGMVHKTHHDPSGRAIGGWIEHNGKRYE